MNLNYQNRIARCRETISAADLVIIGAGAGLSTSDGLDYGGKRFQDNFPDYIERFGLTDMYSSAFFPFPSREERWGYWSRHIFLNRYDYQPGAVYQNLLKLVSAIDYFVITTNADVLFARSGFDPERIFAVQGDYGKFQCVKSCHQTLYDNEKQIRKMVREESNCSLPPELIPICPVCGEELDANLRRDQYFVQDQNWNHSAERYKDFHNKIDNQEVVLMELGVGYNTPSIIKYPFEELTAEHENTALIRINKEYPEISDRNSGKTIAFNEDIGKVLNDLMPDSA